MASKPGILTDWPWKPLGNFKYILLAPFALRSTYSYIFGDEEDRDLFTFLVLPFLLWRMLHNQIWISLSRYMTAKGKNRILDKGIEFEQVDRERNWDDQILLHGLIVYVSIGTIPGTSNLPVWRADGVIMACLLHAGPVEFLYYWFHRALHHHYLYSRYHSHHHSSVVTEPITSVAHPFAEHIAYYALFALTQIPAALTGTASILLHFGYTTYIDFMNNMGHCNFELVPDWVFTYFPLLKYLMYTPSFHSLHHTEFRTNYSLFMPMYDYIYGTTDNSSDQLHEKSLRKEKESPDVVHLTHLMNPDSIYYLRIGFPFLASSPYFRSSKWYLWLMWPITLWTTILTRICGRTFIVERNHFHDLKLHTWVIPKYTRQYQLQQEYKSLNSLIEEAILEAQGQGAKVISLGLLNQGEELNRYGQLYIERHPDLKIKVVDGSSLAVAILIKSIPKGTSQVILRGKLTKIAYALAFTLCQSGIKVGALYENEYDKLKHSLSGVLKNNLFFAKDQHPKIWLIGGDVTIEEQLKAPKGTLFIPFSQIPPTKARNDCLYYYTPAMLVPKSLQNVHSCENWLPRRVMSAWRIAGVLHALEQWEDHEYGHHVLNLEKVWQASLRHGFQPLDTLTNNMHD